MSAEPSLELPLSIQAERLAATIVAHAGTRVTITLPDIFDALDEVEPGLATAPGKRQRVGELIEELVAAGFVEPSRTRLDRSEVPVLPAFVRLRGRPPTRTARSAVGYPWRPELAFAADEILSQREFASLRAVQAFLRDGGGERPVIPAPERSLELFGHEKALDEEIRPSRLWGAGRLGYELLRARRPATPLPHRVVGPGRWILVAENAATFESLAAHMSPDSPVGIVAWGGGGLFRATVEGIADIGLITGREISAIRYFGDLDLEGFRIPMAASVVAERAGLPPVRPAVALYAGLLRVGRPDPATALAPEVATELTAWLGPSLAANAAAVLEGGHRLAQEAVGADWLSSDRHWWTAAGLGPGRAGTPIVPPTAPRGPTQLAPARGGSAILRPEQSPGERVPAGEVDWQRWVPAGRTRNWILGDPLLDWLHAHGAAAGFAADDERPGYDERTDFRRFVLEQGKAFEAGVMTLIRERSEVTVIAAEYGDARSLEKAEATIAAMRAGTPVIAQAVLHNPDTETYGIADLLVRSDLLASWFPEALSFEDASIGAPGIDQPICHYRVIDIKFHSFELTVDGHVGLGADQLAYAGQVWLYNEALGRIQGFIPPASYLLGRTWKQGDERGDGCLDRLARVDHDRWLANRERTLGGVVGDAVAWVRRLRKEGAGWAVLPTPSAPELYPHARNTDDLPWHAAKAEIANELHELTLLPRMNPDRRAAALAAGLGGWDQAGLDAAALGITDPTGAALCNAVLAANRALSAAVLPDEITLADATWRTPGWPEFFVDFEIVSSLDDDFTRLPAIGGQPMVFQIGCGHVDASGTWRFVQWTADRLDPANEGKIIDGWLAHMRATAAALRSSLADARIVHWSPAEPVNLETAYNSARTRHPEADWPTELPWFDFLTKVVRAAPVTVTGAFNFGLKSIAKAMHVGGWIATTWRDGPTDGLGAMVGAWWCDREARRLATSMTTLPLMTEIAAYNEVDCRAMSEIVTWLRANR